MIRFLQLRYKRKFDAAANIGDERLAPVKIGIGTFFPDLVLTAGKKLAGLVEVETGESVNNLEALAQWTHFSRARVPFHLYVPVPGYDTARRLCAATGARPAEVWTYRPTNDGFDLVRIFQDPAAASAKPVDIAPVRPAAAEKVKPAKTAVAKKAKPAAKAKRPATRSAKIKSTAKSARKR